MAQTFVLETGAGPQTAVDPITMEVIQNALVALADEMAFTVARTARSFVLKEALDYSPALSASSATTCILATSSPPTTPMTARPTCRT